MMYPFGRRHSAIPFTTALTRNAAGRTGSRNLRVVCQNDGFVALVPFWAVWPFEILVCSRRHFGSMNEFETSEVRSLSQILQRVTSTYDKVFGLPFPYSMGFHQSPTDDSAHPE